MDLIFPEACTGFSSLIALVVRDFPAGRREQAQNLLVCDGYSRHSILGIKYRRWVRRQQEAQRLIPRSKPHKTYSIARNPGTLPERRMDLSFGVCCPSRMTHSQNQLFVGQPEHNGFR